MSDVDHDAALAEFMGATDCTNTDIAKDVLTTNAWCVPLAVEMYNEMYKAPAAPPRPAPAAPAARTPRHDVDDDDDDYGEYEYDPADFETPNARPGNDSADIVNSEAGRHVGRLDVGPRQHVDRVSTAPQFGGALARMGAPAYAATMSRYGWRDTVKPAEEQRKGIIINLQNRESFDSVRLNRDVWAHDSVANLVRACFFFLQVWDGSTDYDDIMQTYRAQIGSQKAPLILILDPITRMCVRVIPFSSLAGSASITGNQRELLEQARTLATSVEQILINFIDRWSAPSGRAGSMEATSSMGTPSPTRGADVVPLPAPAAAASAPPPPAADDLEEALRLSAETAREEEERRVREAEAAAAAEAVAAAEAAAARAKAALDEVAEGPDAMAPHVVTDGGMRLRVKLPLAGGAIGDWDVRLSADTPLAAFVAGVRREHARRIRGTDAAAPARLTFVINDPRTKVRRVVAVSDQPLDGLLSAAGVRGGDVIWVEATQQS